jgi:hypothetical protein
MRRKSPCRGSSGPENSQFAHSVVRAAWPRAQRSREPSASDAIGVPTGGTLTCVYHKGRQTTAIDDPRAMDPRSSMDHPIRMSPHELPFEHSLGVFPSSVCHTKFAVFRRRKCQSCAVRFEKGRNWRRFLGHASFCRLKWRGGVATKVVILAASRSRNI